MTDIGENGYAVKVTASLYNLDGTQKWTNDAMIDVARDTPTVAFEVPQVPDLSITYFLKLSVNDRFGKVASENFYWLSTKPDEMAWEKTHDTVNTPQSAYADMTALQSLPPVALRVQTKPADSPCATPIAVRPNAAPTTPACRRRGVRRRFSLSAVDGQQSHQDRGLHGPSTAGQERWLRCRARIL